MGILAPRVIHTGHGRGETVEKIGQQFLQAIRFGVDRVDFSSQRIAHQS